jgi:hypothetical protein
MRHALLRIGIVPVIVAIIFLVAHNASSAPPNKPSGPSSTATQNWDTVLPADQRFTVLPGFNNQAVRDNETGLVWERTPNGTQAWEDAIRTCWLRQVGGRMGWHLPMIDELASLVDPTIPAPGPALPPGHPFQNVQSGGLFESAYWSSTTDVRSAFLPTQAWEVRFFDGTTGDSGKSGTRHVWCVRGGTHADKYK